MIMDILLLGIILYSIQKSIKYLRKGKCKTCIYYCDGKCNAELKNEKLRRKVPPKLHKEN